MSRISLRVVNVYTNRHAPGPAVDIYDSAPGAAATPLIPDLAFGAVSGYVHPHLAAYSSDTADLYALPAGTNPVTHSAEVARLDQYEDTGSHPQFTIELLTPDVEPDAGDGPLAGLSFTSEVEKGDLDEVSGPVAPAPPAGSAEILASASITNAFNYNAAYLITDGTCTRPKNGDPRDPVSEIGASGGRAASSDYAEFVTAPGTHEVAAAVPTYDTIPTCSGLNAIRSAPQSVTLAAGEQVETYVYGTSPDDLHLLFAPVRP